MNRASVNSGAPSNDHIYMYLESSPQNRWVSAGDIFEEIKARIIPNLMKTIKPQTHDKSQSWETQKDIINKLLKTSDKEKVLKEGRGKKHITYRERSKNDNRFIIGNNADQKTVNTTFEKKLST